MICQKCGADTKPYDIHRCPSRDQSLVPHGGGEAIQRSESEQCAASEPNDSPIAFTDLLKALRDQIAEIVIPDGEDAGVILLSDESPSDYNETLKCHVYRHMYFSPLGDALVALWQRVDSATKELEMERQERMLAWFACDHLPENLQEFARPFQRLAMEIVERIAAGPERTVALRKLLESKDAAVRAVVKPGG